MFISFGWKQLAHTFCVGVNPSHPDCRGKRTQRHTQKKEKLSISIIQAILSDTLYGMHDYRFDIVQRPRCWLWESATVAMAGRNARLFSHSGSSFFVLVEGSKTTDEEKKEREKNTTSRSASEGADMTQTTHSLSTPKKWAAAEECAEGDEKASERKEKRKHEQRRDFAIGRNFIGSRFALRMLFISTIMMISYIVYGEI